MCGLHALPGCDNAYRNIGRHQLKFDLPSDGDGVLVVRACFVAKDLKINCETTCSQTGHDGIAGSNAVFVAPGLEGLLKDEVTIGVMGNHDILVARPCSDREAAGIVRVEFADGDDPDEDLIGRGFGNGNRWGRGKCGLGLG